MYGRNGEAPIPIISAISASDCFITAFEACKIAIEHNTPVIMLSDGFIANGAEPWKFPSFSELGDIKVSLAEKPENGEKYFPYKRDEKLVRKMAIPGTPGLEHRIGGLEKEHETGNISYDPENHEFKVKLRAEKVARIANYLPAQKLDNGPEKGKLLILGWGSTYGSIKTAVKIALAQNLSVAHAQVRYLNPFPKNLGEMLNNYDHVLIPEMNNGQLVRLIRDQYGIDAKGLNKIKGIPFTADEIFESIKTYF